jgi:hypothetical protein
MVSSDERLCRWSNENTEEANVQEEFLSWSSLRREAWTAAKDSTELASKREKVLSLTRQRRSVKIAHNSNFAPYTCSNTNLVSEFFPPVHFMNFPSLQYPFYPETILFYHLWVIFLSVRIVEPWFSPETMTRHTILGCSAHTTLGDTPHHVRLLVFSDASRHTLSCLRFYLLSRLGGWDGYTTLTTFVEIFLLPLWFMILFIIAKLGLLKKTK